MRKPFTNPICSCSRSGSRRRYGHVGINDVSPPSTNVAVARRVAIPNFAGSFFGMARRGPVLIS